MPEHHFCTCVYIYNWNLKAYINYTKMYTFKIYNNMHCWLKNRECKSMCIQGGCGNFACSAQFCCEPKTVLKIKSIKIIQYDVSLHWH